MKKKFPIQLFGLVALLACLAGPSLHAKELGSPVPVTKMYLAITGVTGDVTDPGFEGQIEILSYSWTPTSGPGEMSLVKNIDSSSPRIFAIVASGTLLKAATLSVVGSQLMTIDMRNVLITSVVNGSGTESITLSFQRSKVSTKKGGIDPDPGTGIFLDLKGITGDVTYPGFEGQIEVISFSWTPTSGPGEISLTKYIDSSSPRIFAAVASGTLPKTARLTVLASGLTIDLRDVLITSVVTGSGTESITLSFQRSKTSH